MRRVVPPALAALLACLSFLVITDAGGAHAAGGAKGEYLFVQTAAGGHFAPIGGDRYRLTLRGVDPHVTYFSDRPSLDTGVIPQRTLFDGAFRPGYAPPNAALDVLGSELGRDVTAMRLSHPHYDPRARTLSYRIRLLRKLDDKPLAHYNGRLASRPPADFGPASLFIDGLPAGTSCVLNLRTTINGGLAFESASKWPTDEWKFEPKEGTGIPPNESPLGGGSTIGGAFRGCHFSTVWSPGPGGTVTISLTDPWSGGNSFPCEPSDRALYTCTLEPQSVIHGPILDVYYSIEPS